MSDQIKVIGSETSIGKLLNSTYETKYPFKEVGPNGQVIFGKIEKLYRSIESFEVRDEDVFVLAFPKTGSRWTQEMVWLILNNLDYKRAQEIMLPDRSPFFERETIFDDVPEDKTIKGLSTMKSPRCFKSHLQWTLLPKAIRSGTKQPKIIVVLREPEDTCTSSYYQAKTIEGFVGTWEDYCTLFLAGKVLFGPYWSHVLGYWEQRHRPNILIIKFNKMKRNLPETVREVAVFLEKSLSDDQVNDLCNHLTFDNLKKSHGFNMNSFIKTPVNPFVRKGQIGDYKNAMSAEYFTIKFKLRFKIMSDQITVIESDSYIGKLLNSTYKTYGPFKEVGPNGQVIFGKVKELYNSIQNFEVRDDDVFVLAFPKTGSRWMQEMVWLILNNLDFNKAQELFLFERSQLLELEVIYDKTSEKRTIQGLSNIKSPRCLKSHLQWSLLPKAIRTDTKRPKIIVVLREPEDTCTSSYHQAKIVEGFVGTWEDYCTLFLAGKVLYGPYWNHVLGYWEQKHRSNILFVKFNKMKNNLPETVREVAGFLGKQLSDDQVNNLCKHLTFDNLKKNKGFNMEHIIKTGVNPFIRKGQIGDYKNIMSAEEIEKFRIQREQFLEGTDLSFD
ncbi:hypothetical protein FQR65_LT05360 [Abscondita terminalis]|nr:hypothetical protein FQR65_LT05360 [Abscondita terminalis]